MKPTGTQGQVNTTSGSTKQRHLGGRLISIRLGTAPQRTLLNPSGSAEGPGPGSYETAGSRKNFKVAPDDDLVCLWCQAFKIEPLKQPRTGTV